MKKMIDTNVELKAQHWQAFSDLIKDQFTYGAKKYAENESPGNREATDLIIEGFGIGWVLGTMMKYLLRFRNQNREKDLLKIACYSYILWLKLGFHKERIHDTDTGK